MSGHLLTLEWTQRQSQNWRFNPLHVGAPTHTGITIGTLRLFDVSIPSMSGHLLEHASAQLLELMRGFQSPPCRGTYWNCQKKQFTPVIRRFNPLHVVAPTGTEFNNAKANIVSFNPLHVGAPTDTLYGRSGFSENEVSIPSMSGHLLERRNTRPFRPTTTFQSPPCRGTYWNLVSPVQATVSSCFNPLHVGAPTGTCRFPQLQHL